MYTNYMYLVLFNLKWMSLNVVLAVIPILFGMLMLQTSSKLLKWIYGVVWLVFLPNTLYLLTDVTHFIDDWPKIPLQFKSIFFLEYTILVVLGIITFILAVYPSEKLLQKKLGKKKIQHQELIILGINFLVGFGMVLGRVERINSWEVVTNASKVLFNTIHTLTTLNLLLLAIFYGLFGNVIYFCFKDFLIKTGKLKTG